MHYGCSGGGMIHALVDNKPQSLCFICCQIVPNEIKLMTYMLDRPMVGVYSTLYDIVRVQKVHPDSKIEVIETYLR